MQHPFNCDSPPTPCTMPGVQGMEIPNEQAGAFQGQQNENMA